MATDKTIRIPFDLNLSNPEHIQVYNILKKSENRNAYIRHAILATKKENSQDQITREDIRQVVRECFLEVLEDIRKSGPDDGILTENDLMQLRNK